MSAPFLKPATATVLVVDDDPFIRIVIAEALEEAGYNAIEAESAEIALDLLLTSRSVDILITDIHLMSTINGHELASKACDIFPALKVILMTGDLVAGLGFTGGPAPAARVLVKPFRLEDLWDVVEGLMRAP